MSKHKRPDGWGGTLYGPGPARWARAAHNALIRPNSQGARLYQRRVSLAYTVAEECRQSLDVHPNQAYEHIDWQGKRSHVTCSVFCTVMVVQLDHRAENLDEIKLAFSENHKKYAGRDAAGMWIFEDTGVQMVRQLDPKTMKRSRQCFYCATPVGGTK